MINNIKLGMCEICGSPGVAPLLLFGSNNGLSEVGSISIESGCSRPQFVSSFCAPAMQEVSAEKRAAEAVAALFGNGQWGEEGGGIAGVCHLSSKDALCKKLADE